MWGWLRAAQGEPWSQLGSQGQQQLRDAEGHEGLLCLSSPSREGVPAAWAGSDAPAPVLRYPVLERHEDARAEESCSA